MKRKYLLILISFLLISNIDISAQVNDNDKFFRINQIGVKTNILQDAALVPNLGVEILLNKRWSFGVSWFYAWWSQSNHNRFWKTYGGEFEARKWLGKRSYDNNVPGHHIGVYFM